MEYIILIYIAVLTATQYTLGYVLIERINVVCGSVPEPGLQAQPSGTLAVTWLFGLLVHLCGAFALKSMGAPWWLAIVLPFAPLAFFYRALPQAWLALKTATCGLKNIPTLLWLAVHCVLGVSLFAVHDGIRTPWVNNYGDLTFHLGMISHFVAHGVFPPEYHIFVGETLSYPFFVNLWSAILWLPVPGWAALPWVFAAQWVLLWGVVYAFFARSRGAFLPWLLLLGGGSIVAVVMQPGVFSWRLINEGYPWTTWLSTIWVTQRSALMGLAVCVCSVALVFRSKESQSRGAIAVAGLLLAMSPLVHTHYFLVTTLFLGAYLFLLALAACVKGCRAGECSWSACWRLRESRDFLTLFLLTSLCVLFFPLLLGKSSMASLMLGWSVPVQPAGWSSLSASVVMWLVNASPWLVAMAVLWCVSRMHLAFALIVGLFVFGNVVKLATWDWDQLKFFLAVFSLFIVVWGRYLRVGDLGWKRMLPHYFLAVALAAPGVYELARVGLEKPDYQVYTPTKLALANMIRHKTSRDAIIASPADHNSAATLSGRPLFFGYPGTLASHSLDYQERERVQLDLLKIQRCIKVARFDMSLCPTHVVWDHSARNYWHRVVPTQGFKKIGTVHGGRYALYEVESTLKAREQNSGEGGF